MLPVIALVGRPNVGKSTLFNRLTRSRDAIVADMPGLTRDRKYGQAQFNERSFIVVDTGGISGDEAGVDLLMARQSIEAVKEAQLILFLVDGRAGLTATDEQIALQLRQMHKQVVLVVNKTDGVDAHSVSAEFYRLGFEHLFPIAAAHGRGVSSMMETVLELLGPAESDAGLTATEWPEGAIKIAVLGRPNVGKSTLVNRILGEERVIAFDLPGTTRDSIYIPFQRNDEPYVIIDTAGVRRRAKVTEVEEKFSVIKALQAIEDANVVLLLIDATENVTEQDLGLIGFVMDAGRALVLAINKWDGLPQEQRDFVKRELDRRLDFCQFAKLHFISALHGSGVGDLFKSIREAYRSATLKVSTSKLNEMLQAAVAQHQPPLVKGRRVKLRYAHFGGHNPPIIVIHGNQTAALPSAYQRYLINHFREALGLVGTPIRLELREGENPFAGRKNTLTERQIQKKRRLMQHVKGRK